MATTLPSKQYYITDNEKLYYAMDFNAVNFGYWLLQNKIEFRLNHEGIDLYCFPIKSNVVYTVKELYDEFIKQWKP